MWLPIEARLDKVEREQAEERDRDNARKETQINISQKQTEIFEKQVALDRQITRLTKWLVCVGIVGVIVTTWQTVASWRNADAAVSAVQEAQRSRNETIEEMGLQTEAIRETLAETQRQTQSMIDAAKAAESAVEEAKLSRGQAKAALDTGIAASRTDQRAWVGVHSITRAVEDNAKDPSVGDQLTFVIHIQNSGRTPANGVAIHREIDDRFPTESHIDMNHEKQLAERGEFAISPAVGFPHKTLTIPLTKALVAGVLERKPMYFYGTIHYRDVWNTNHETTFCAIWVYK